MANKRTLKRTINCVCEALFAECVAVSIYDHGSKPNADALLGSILAINNDFISRVSHVEPGMQPKVYFCDLMEQFNKQVCEIVDQIENFG